MPVSIREFEILPGAAPRPENAESQQSAQSATPRPPTPQEIQDLIRRAADRSARLSAY
ncbi:MAG: hypothetical protein ACM3XM_05520 [Mycobacterium leprae]